MSGLTIVAVVFVAYALVASRLDRWWITAPMVFVAAGVILGPHGLGRPVSLSGEAVLTITELTLALLLFCDAATVRLRDVEGDASLPSRLLFVGLPLAVAAGTLIAHLLLPGAGWPLAALIATILAPTDAALGLAVVTSRAVWKGGSDESSEVKGETVAAGGRCHPSSDDGADHERTPGMATTFAGQVNVAVRDSVPQGTG